ncbi:branched-chain amino acid transport system II carrier protein [Actinomyces faecalis]|uniref:branched-chain amino acid transport system II carrier protein n=1 Tax=Actinomyces faecalis TaxID=2722820 RepID=UPI00155811EA|nr:branched-chain amino acid transport system II carrier protein [Actinomyces faecalis]
MSDLSSPSTTTSSPIHVVTTGLMLFALFFGAGNLIFPPVLGASAGNHMWQVVLGFCLTGVLLPLVAVIAVSTSGEGILGLARRVGPTFGTLMPLAVYLSIGPMYAVPRVVTVSYELATRPVLELMGTTPGSWALPAHATIFLGTALVLGLRPSRLADRIGRWLTPSLLILIAVLCAITITQSAPLERPAQPGYDSHPLVIGLTKGYLTMDVLAATVFGIVVIQSLRSHGFTSTRAVTRATIGAGSLAAALLAAVYVGLAMIGARTPGQDVSDGTALLRDAASSALGSAGVVVLAGIVLLACLTTAVGLLSSFSAYAHTAWPKVPFATWLTGSTAVSFALANLGLATVLAIISPLTLLLYPIAITLVAVTLVDAAAPGHLRATYLLPVATAIVLGAVSAASDMGWTTPSDLLARTGMWNDSTGWIVPTLVVVLIGIGIDVATGRWSTPASDLSGADDDVARVAAQGF